MTPNSLKINFTVAPDAKSLAQQAAALFTEGIAAAISERGVARIAVSGGSTPKATFALLADDSQPWKAQIDWSRLYLYFVDERTVPPEDKDSNYRMTSEALLAHVPLPAEQVFRMEGELDPEQAAARYESAIRNSMRLEGAQLPVFDLISLGMGDDAHTASLFPYTEAIHELGRVVVANHVPQKDTWRITLTWPAINQARQVFFLIGGADKAGPLHHVYNGPRDPEQYPSQLIRPASGKLTLLLDGLAAAGLAQTTGKTEGSFEVTR